MTVKQRAIIILVAIAAAFSLIAFVAPFPKNEVFWAAYAFGAIAVAAQFYFAKSAFSGSVTAKSRIYGFPIARVGVIYVTVQLVVSLIQMALAAYLPTWVGFVLNVVILVLALIGGIGTEIARDAVSKMEATISTNTEPMTDIRLTCESLLTRCEDGKLRGELAKLSEAIRFSDPTSDETTAAAEGKIRVNLDAIGKAIDAGDIEGAYALVSQAILDTKDRNAIRKARRRG